MSAQISQKRDDHLEGSFTFLFTFIWLTYQTSAIQGGFWQKSATVSLIFWTVTASAFLFFLLKTFFTNKPLTLPWVEKKISYLSTHFFSAFFILFSILNVANLIAFGYTYFRFANLGYQKPWLHSLITVAALGVGYQYRKQPKTLVKIAIYSHLAFFLASVWSFPLAPERSDMLPVIERAWQSLLAGHSPYEVLTVGTRTDNRMPYLPGTWLSFFPSALLHIDLRYSSLLWKFLLGLLVTLKLKRVNSPSVLIMALLFFLNPHLNTRHDLYFDFFLLLIFLIFSSALQIESSRYRKLILLGIAVLTRQWSWVIAPFILVGELKNSQLTTPPKPAQAGSKKKTIFQVALPFMFGSAVILIPSALLLNNNTTISEILESIFAFQNSTMLDSFRPEYGLSFMALLHRLNIGRLQMQGLQLAALVAIFFVFIKAQFKTLTCQLSYQKRSPQQLAPIRPEVKLDHLSYSLLALCLFILLNPHFWSYFWLTPLTALLASAMSIESSLPSNT